MNRRVVGDVLGQWGVRGGSYAAPTFQSAAPVVLRTPADTFRSNCTGSGGYVHFTGGSGGSYSFKCCKDTVVSGSGTLFGSRPRTKTTCGIGVSYGADGYPA